MIERKDAVLLHSIEAALAEVILECLLGLVGKLLQILVYRVPIHALALGFERTGLGLADGAGPRFNLCKASPTTVKARTIFNTRDAR